MKSTIFFVLLISACSRAEEEEEESVSQRSQHAAQGHIQYSDPDGLKVSWKLYAPYAQWKAHLENPQRGQQQLQQQQQQQQQQQRIEQEAPQVVLAAHADAIKPAAVAVSSTAPVVAPLASSAEERALQPSHQFEVHYKPYSMVPSHIKQLILQMYQPQQPYVDPSVYIYRAHPEPQEEPKQAAVTPEPEEAVQAMSQPSNEEPRYEHIPNYQVKYSPHKSKFSYVEYKEEQPNAEETVAPQYGSVPERKEAAPVEVEQQPQQVQQPQQPIFFEESMPKELHQLLSLQAQTPYHVIANRIYYKPKTIFVPKPLTEEMKGPYKYHSKVYFVKNEDFDEKPKERVERGEEQQLEQQQQAEKPSEKQSEAQIEQQQQQ